MRREICLLILLFLGLSSQAGAASETCGDPPPPQFRDENNESIKGDLEGKAKFLSGFVGKAELGGKIEATRKEIFTKYPDANKSRTDAYMAYIFCRILFDPKNTQTPAEKLKALEEYRRQSQHESSSLSEPKLPTVHQYENSGIIANLAECRSFTKQVTCHIEFKSSDLSSKGIGLFKSKSIMYDNKSIPYKASAVFLVNEESTNDNLKKKIAPGGMVEGRVVFNDVPSETEKVSELIVHTVIHQGYGVWSQNQFKFYNINLSKQQYSKPR